MPVVVVNEVEVTKLVPFEPTPPGYAPPDDWKPGMPMPDLTRTKILPRPTPPQPGLAKPPRRKLIGSGRRPRPYDNQETTMSPDERNHKSKSTVYKECLELRLLNESLAFNETMLQNLTETETTPESYTGNYHLNYRVFKNIKNCLFQIKRAHQKVFV